MKKKLSQIPNFNEMSLMNIVKYCLDNNIQTIINDYGYGLELDISDLKYVWEDIRKTVIQ
jgi:hypothetical protein